jgi:hypothetical protein
MAVMRVEVHVRHDLGVDQRDDLRQAAGLDVLVGLDGLDDLLGDLAHEGLGPGQGLRQSPGTTAGHPRLSSAGGQQEGPIGSGSRRFIAARLDLVMPSCARHSAQSRLPCRNARRPDRFTRAASERRRRRTSSSCSAGGLPSYTRLRRRAR